MRAFPRLRSGRYLRTQLPLADDAKSRIRVALSKQGNSVDCESFQSDFGEVLAQHRHDYRTVFTVMKPLI